MPPFESPFYERCDDLDCPHRYAYDHPLVREPLPHWHYIGPPGPEPDRWADL